MNYLITYVAAAAIFAAVDLAWLSTIGGEMFRRALGDMLLASFRPAPAILFYLLYPVGLLIFAVYPGIKAAAPPTAVIYGALFGLFCYATYELTNFATLRNWTTQLVVVDTAYGAIASGVVAGAVALLAPLLLNALGMNAR